MKPSVRQGQHLKANYKRLSRGQILLIAALAIVFVYHGALLFSGSYQRTYDAWVHIFFGDHYRRWWFSSWDPRWYTGFSTVSYPPGAHQSIALLSHFIGLRSGFVLVQLFALINLTIGVYRWSKLWVNDEAAGWAAVLLATCSSISETVHVFGQLPTTFSLGFLLNSLPFAYRWVHDGHKRSLLIGITATAATTAGHHVTTLFGSVFFAGPVLLAAVVSRFRTPLTFESSGHPLAVSKQNLWPLIARRLRRVWTPLLRTAIYGGFIGCALIIVVLPYWLWSHSDPITQVSIPHASRDNFLINKNAGLVFWLVPWGLMLTVLPYALLRGITSKAWPLALCIALLTFLGTGGTTPFPKMLLGPAYDILTLDRFTFWATIAILPLAGQFVTSLLHGSLGRLLVNNLGRPLALGVRGAYAILFLVISVYCTNLTHYRPFQPATINIEPIIAFMDKDEHWHWRYLALGFGDQMAWLSANMTSTTVDGDYHSARRLPELTSEPIERLEGAKYSGIPGIGSLQQFLAVPSRYNLKYVFSNDQFYDPLLHFSGWHSLGPLENGVTVWEREDIPPLPESPVLREIPMWQRQLWGFLPMTAITFAISLLIWASFGQRVPGLLMRLEKRLSERISKSKLTIYIRKFDRWLERSSIRISGPKKPQHWRPGIPIVERFRIIADRHITKRRVAIHIGVLVVCLLSATTLLVFEKQKEPSASEVITKYYEHLDFRRFGEAYQLLNPSTRPDMVSYRTQLATDGGLVASFSKLANVKTELLKSQPTHQVLRADVVYLTSLSSYQLSTTFELNKISNKWYIDLPPADATEPPDQFTNRPTVDFLQLGRRSVKSDSSDATSTADVLDRPQIMFNSVQSLLVDGRWSVIGNVTNVDVDPADVTVSAQIRSPQGQLLATYDAAQVMIHKILPGETTPFRIEFEAVAGTAPSLDAPQKISTTSTTTTMLTPEFRKPGPIEFDPSSIVPYVLPPDASVGSIDVYGRAVVTSRETNRSLQLLDLHLEHQAGTYELVGTLRNDGTVEAAVPHLLFSYKNEGKLTWVDHQYLESSLRPQRTLSFRFPIDKPKLQPTGITTNSYANGTTELSQQTQNADSNLKLPLNSGFSEVSVTASAYFRGTPP